jgi:mannose-6-phosphate isomerase-like protein (cupin superfamily)
VSILAGLEQVEPDRNARRDLWRLLGQDTVSRIGATAGVAAYHDPVDTGPVATAPELGAAHEFPEIYFVLDGTGQVHTPDGARTVSAGDAFVVLGGVPHTIVGTGAPLRTFYVSLKTGVPTPPESDGDAA